MHACFTIRDSVQKLRGGLDEISAVSALRSKVEEDLKGQLPASSTQSFSPIIQMIMAPEQTQSSIS